jgi:hypothetical protein
MPIPLILLAAGAVGLGLRERTKRQTAFNTALTSFTHDPNGVGPPLPGHESGAMLTPTQAAGLANLYRSNPAQAVTQLNQLQGRNQTAHQNTLTRELQWQQLGQARQTFQLTQERFRVQQEQFAHTNDLEQIRLRKEAGDLGAIYVNDPLNNNARTRTAAPGSKEWRELQAGAVATAQASATLNELIVSEAKFGVIRDPSAPGGRSQQSLRTRLVGEIKEVLTLGALDEGVLNFATGLVGSELNAADFILGDDAASLERLLTTQGLFNNQMTLRAEDLRLLQGVNPALVQGFSQVQQQSAALNQFVTERIGRIRAAGGDVSDLIERPEIVMEPGGGVFGGFRRTEPGVQLTGPGAQAPTGIETLRGTANVFGNQLDAITSTILGAIVGRAIPR